jgi:Na+/H+ antiporter NhaA
MSLFVSNLAFPGNDWELTASKLGILMASVLAGMAGMGILFTAEPQRMTR